MKRQDIIQAMREKPDIPVLIIGGGINGAGLYRERSFSLDACIDDQRFKAALFDFFFRNAKSCPLVSSVPRIAIVSFIN